MEEYQVPEFILSNQEEEAEAVPHEAEPMEERQTNPLEQLHAALNLAKAMPPSKLRKNLIGLTTLAPNIEDALQQRIDLPMEIENTNQQDTFLKTEFNRDGDSYRSSITNTYHPQIQGYLPNQQFRQFEKLGVTLFNQYTKLYYGNTGVGSFFVLEGANDNEFSCGYFAKKNIEEEEAFSGSWDSFNTVDVKIEGNQATLHLNSTVLIEMNIKKEVYGVIELTGFLKKQKTEKRNINKQRLETLLVGVGEMIQDMETVMRQHLQAVYIGKTKEVIFSSRLEYTKQYEMQRQKLAKGLKDIHLGH